MRKACLDAVYQLAKTDERIVFIGSDLGVGTLDKFKTEMPDRFLIEGVSEANIIGLAAGLALEGRVVYVNTIATFLTRRCFEQVVLDLCLHNTNVRLIGNGGGLVYAPLGPTHEAIEDIAICRAIPRMTIVAPADADEMRRAMALTVDYQGPIYIRVAKGGDPIVSRADVPFEIGKALMMRRGGDAVVVTTGITLKMGLEAAAALEAEGLDVGVVHVPTLKPFDRDAVVAAASAARVVVTVEEHSVIGGLGSTVAEALAEANFHLPKRFKRIGIPDVFADEYGSQDSLLTRYGITASEVAATVRGLCGAPLLDAKAYSQGAH